MTRARFAFAWTLLASALASLLVACSSPSPDIAARVAIPDRLTAVVPAAPAASDAARCDPAPAPAASASAQGAWWSGFGDCRVDGLVRRALANNQTVAAAQATLKQAHELTAAQAAVAWPTLDASLGAVQTRGANAGVINSAAPRARTALLSASYSPDLFGLNAHATDSLAAQEDATRWQLRATRLSLAGGVVSALAAEKSAVRQEQLLSNLVEIDEQVLVIVRARRVLGDVPELAVWAQVQQVHDRKASLAAGRLQTAQARDLLASLLGVAPGAYAEPPLGFDDLAVPDLPATLPGDIVNRRPDVQMAAAQFRAADASRAAAAAALLPQLTLTGDAGYVAGAVSRLFDPASFVWDLGAAATQRIFDAGAQRHRTAAAQAFADAQSAQYAATVVGAFKDVADSLEAVRYDTQADLEATARTDAARHQFEIAERSRALGQLSRQDVLAAQSQWLQFELAQVQTRSARIVDAADAMVSLGGAPDVRCGDACAD